MRAVLVEDQALLSDIMVKALTLRDVTVVGCATNAEEAIRAVRVLAPELMILDIRLPPTWTDEGIRIAEQVRRSSPEVALTVLSSYAEVSFAERLLRMEERSRGIGYLLKDRVGDLDQLVDVMHRVAAGEVVIDTEIIDQLMNRPRKGPLDRLTAHERRVLAMVAEGRSNLGIAQRLGSRPSTVEKHLSTITEKLGLPSTSDLNRPSINVRVLAAITFLRAEGRVP